ncbi:MAG: DUF5060 domain-containing protein [Verrucomicrobiae bacterium]|nr:DUF5060 domain-containing protein [Verrucomicrobiae bacterium]
MAGERGMTFMSGARLFLFVASAVFLASAKPAAGEVPPPNAITVKIATSGAFGVFYHDASLISEVALIAPVKDWKGWHFDQRNLADTTAALIERSAERVELQGFFGGAGVAFRQNLRADSDGLHVEYALIAEKTIAPQKVAVLGVIDEKILTGGSCRLDGRERIFPGQPRQQLIFNGDCAQADFLMGDFQCRIDNNAGGFSLDDGRAGLKKNGFRFWLFNKGLEKLVSLQESVLSFTLKITHSKGECPVVFVLDSDRKVCLDLDVDQEGRWGIRADGRQVVTDMVWSLVDRFSKKPGNYLEQQKKDLTVKRGGGEKFENGGADEQTIKNNVLGQEIRVKRNWRKISGRLSLEFDIAPLMPVDPGSLALACYLPAAKDGNIVYFRTSKAGVYNRGVFRKIARSSYLLCDLAQNVDKFCWLYGGDRGIAVEIESDADNAAFHEGYFGSDLYGVYFFPRLGRDGAGQRVKMNVYPINQWWLSQQRQRLNSIRLERRKLLEPVVSPGLRPAIVEVRAAKNRMEKFDKFEVDVRLEAVFKNPYDPREIELTGEFHSPDGKIILIPGFFYQGYEKKGTGLLKAGNPVWKIRFTPQMAGRWKYLVKLRNAGETIFSPEGFFQVEGGARKGFVKINKKNPLYFQFSDGSDFFPVGVNLAYPEEGFFGDYERWLSKLAKNGGNATRLFLHPFSCGVEWSDSSAAGSCLRSNEGLFYGVGKYSQDNSWRLDWLLEEMARKGVYTVVCLTHAMQLAGWWDMNPYNAQQGGPCKKKDDFWTNAEAKRLYKQYLRYFLSRFGHCQQIYIYNPLAEINAPLDWISEMHQYIRENDVYGHLLTHNFGSAEVWSQPCVDVIDVHHYGEKDGNWPDCVELLNAQGAALTKKFGKPYLIGEMGLDWTKPDSYFDRSGVCFHNALWSSLFSRHCGTALYWYWDKYIDYLNLWNHLLAIRKYSSDIRFDHEFEPFRIPGRDVQIPGAREAYEDLIMTPTAGAIRNDIGGFFEVGDDGWVVGDGPVGFSLNGKAPGGAPRNEPHFKFKCVRPTRFVVAVRKASENARLGIVINGISNFDAKVEDGKQYEVEIPGGEVEAEVKNNANDGYIEVRNIILEKFKKVSTPGARVLGMRSSEQILCWIQDEKSNWRGRKEKILDPLSGAVFKIKGISPGDHEIEWWDAYDGRVLRKDVCLDEGGWINVRVPEFCSDIACKIRRLNK